MTGTSRTNVPEGEGGGAGGEGRGRWLVLSPQLLGSLLLVHQHQLFLLIGHVLVDSGHFA